MSLAPTINTAKIPLYDYVFASAAEMSLNPPALYACAQNEYNARLTLSIATWVPKKGHDMWQCFFPVVLAVMYTTIGELHESTLQ